MCICSCGNEVFMDYSSYPSWYDDKGLIYSFLVFMRGPYLLPLDSSGNMSWQHANSMVYIVRARTGRSVYKIFVHHVHRIGICLGAIYIQGTN